ncbi:dynamin family protein [Microbacteriaceae bacterium 4G12]
MIETLHSKQLQSLLFLYEMWEKKGDVQNSTKLLEVIRKYTKNEFMIAFCGHFSAGKSTMMNHLYGEALLPTSPIPTSANVVKIQKGQDQVVLTLKSGEKIAYEGAYTEAQFKQLCKNGDEVIGVHIYRQDTPLPDGVMLVDTPGIDSTDDAHKLATESALHLADVIFYMMDYNHVQSEVNLQFVKELKQRHKRVFLVINQIDKHKEEELTFTSYQQSVQDSFANWNIEVDGIYYTSLRKKEHTYNELASLQQLLASIVENRQSYMEESMQKEITYLLQQHLEWMNKEDQEKTESVPLLSYDEVEAKLTQLYKEEIDVQTKEQTIKISFLDGLEHILQNAYLMPFEVRDLANNYLETQLSNFKVGLFFSKGKTEKEKEQRLLSFYDKLKQTVETQLDFHIKEFILSFLKNESMYTEEIGESVYQLVVSFEPSVLTGLVKQGAGLSGDYVLNYTNDVANELKRLYRKESVSFLDNQLSRFGQTWHTELEQIQQQIRQYAQEKAVWEAIASEEREQELYANELFDVWEGRKDSNHTIDLAVIQEEQLTSSMEASFFEAAAPEVVTVQEEQVIEKNMTAQERIHAILEHVQHGAKAIEGITALRHLYDEIMEKRKRIETKQFTIALFGAFSAGKSSFANALLGEKVLPVSPNPTTATINKILPVTKERPHGTVRIQVKSKEILLEDLQQIYKLFEKEAHTLEEAISRIDELLRHPSPTGRQKTTFSFLRALQKGYSAFLPMLGDMLVTTREEFAEYVANEEKSCFVEYMELYYDCELTQNGITLVDTPGADSINARHTDVAFQYIKDADAILFVTYYNHVFSRADREFLIQLGRVKDSFSLDKMFFLINAADLAESIEELQTVKAYIANQLLEYGIRNPRLFAVSSLFALEEKTGIVSPGKYGILEQSGMQAFERAFTSFTTRDLMLVSLTALQGAVKRSYTLVDSMITNALGGNEQKEINRKKYEQEWNVVKSAIASYSVLTEEKGLEKEIRELLYYVKQRIFLRYQDVFVEFFNPATLRSDRKDMKGQLQECLTELVAFLQNDLLQEMRATSLRVEKWMNTKVQAAAEEVEMQCLQHNTELMFSTESHHYSSVTHVEPFQEIDWQQFKKALSYFKNAKSFFENNEKVRMQEEIKNVLEPLVDQYVEQEQKLFMMHYQAEWKTAWKMTKETMNEDVEQYYTGILYALSEKIDVSLYKEALHALQWRIEATASELEQL